VIACWCQREETPSTPFTEKEKNDLQFLYDEWAHPYFISYQEFARLMQVCARAWVWVCGNVMSISRFCLFRSSLQCSRVCAAHQTASAKVLSTTPALS
jgi:hypothetical protein